MFGDKPRVPSVNKMKQASAKDFSGGLNTVDSPLNLSSKYCIDLRNMYPESSGRLRLRYGTTKFSTITAGQSIVNMEYYSGVIVAVTAQGNIYTINDAGDVTQRTFSPSWTLPVVEVNFSQFGGNLIITNGVDLPLRMVPALTVDYLVDAGTGLNTYVPRGKFSCTHNNYNVMAGISAEPSTLSISAKGTDGTFVGAPLPNDGVKLNLATYINIGDSSITGITSFRDQLIVTFEQVIVSVKLGTYDAGGAHVPAVQDVIENVGALSHRSIVALGDDVVFQDLAGVSSVKRALITATLSPVRESSLISDRINTATASISLDELSRTAFAIHDRIESQVLFFVPKVSPVADDTDNNVFVYNFNVGARYRSFTYFDQLAFRCGCRTQENRIFFATGNTIYRYQSRYEDTYGDLRLNVLNGSAVPTPFRIETPWTDLRDPINSKLSKYLQVIAEGAAQFTVDMYVDRQSTTPDLSMEFYASDEPIPTRTAWYWTDDFGEWSWSTDIGLWSDGDAITSRPAISEQLYAWPTKFKRAKFVIHGSATTELGIVAITLLYHSASIRR